MWWTCDSLWCGLWGRVDVVGCAVGCCGCIVLFVAWYRIPLCCTLLVGWLVLVVWCLGELWSLWVGCFVVSVDVA